MLDTCRVQLYNNSTTQLNIIAPTGAYGNHLRTLLLLDPRYSFTIAPRIEEYNIFAGGDWPNYDVYSRSGLPDSTVENIKQEISDLCLEHDFLNFYQIDSLSAKNDFIFRELYTDQRSWHNWLWAERRWRVHLDYVINLEHTMPSVLNNTKYIILTIDPNNSYKSYLKFNSNLNILPVEEFLKLIETYNQQALAVDSGNALVIPIDNLFAETLDYNLYTNITNWLGYDNLHADASKVHRVWYNLHKKCERELVEFFTNFYPS